MKRKVERDFSDIDIWTVHKKVKLEKDVLMFSGYGEIGSISTTKYIEFNKTLELKFDFKLNHFMSDDAAVIDIDFNHDRESFFSLIYHDIGLSLITKEDDFATSIWASKDVIDDSWHQCHIIVNKKTAQLYIDQKFIGKKRYRKKLNSFKVSVGNNNGISSTINQLGLLGLNILGLELIIDSKTVTLDIDKFKQNSGFIISDENIWNQGGEVRVENDELYLTGFTNNGYISFTRAVKLDQPFNLYGKFRLLEDPSEFSAIFDIDFDDGLGSYISLVYHNNMVRLYVRDSGYENEFWRCDHSLNWHNFRVEIGNQIASFYFDEELSANIAYKADVSACNVSFSNNFIKSSVDKESLAIKDILLMAEGSSFPLNTNKLINFSPIRRRKVKRKSRTQL